MENMVIDEVMKLCSLPVVFYSDIFRSPPTEYLSNPPLLSSPPSEFSC